MSDEELQEKEIKEQQKKEDAHEAGKKVAKTAAKVAGEYFAPGAGGAIVDKVASTPAGEKILDTASDAITKIPGMEDKLAKAKPVIDKADQALSVASAASNPSGAAGSAGASANAANAAGNTASVADSTSNTGANMPKANKPNTNANSVEIKSNKPIHGQNLRQNDQNTLQGSDSYENDAPKDEEDPFGPKEEPQEQEYQEESVPEEQVEQGEPEKKKGSFLKKMLIKTTIMSLAPWISLAVPIIILIFGAISLMSDSSSGKPGMGGLTYYDTTCNQVTVVDSEHEGENGYSINGTYDLDTYIAGVVVAEVGGFHNEEIFKAFAVAARTYAMRYFESSGTCTIAGNTTKQSFMSIELAESKGHDMTVVMDAVKSTMGMVITDKQGKLASTEYDAFCMDHTDANYYYLRQKNQAIDRTWVEEKVPSSYRSGVCAGGHGRGMSQYGALYLATTQTKNYQEILKFYYGDIAFKTILKSSASTNYTIATSTGANDQIHEPLQSFLQKSGSSVTAFNSQIMSAVKESGPGTRDGVVAAATSLIGTLYQQYGGRIPYTYGGGHYVGIFNTSGESINRSTQNYYGVDPLWGSEIRNARGGKFTMSVNGSMVPYYYYGPDCSGFVTWAIKNGGFNAVASTSQNNWGPKHYMNGSYQGKPGDLIWHPGHIMMIVGVDEDAKQYYIAHASGGSEGVKINPVPFSWKDNYIIDMTEWYAKNVTTNDPIEYERIFDAGKLA